MTAVTVLDRFDVELEALDDEVLAAFAGVATVADDGTVAVVRRVTVLVDALDVVACCATYGTPAASAATATPEAAARLRQLRCQRLRAAEERIVMASRLAGGGKSGFPRP